MAKYQLTYNILDTEEEARMFCDNENKCATRHIRTKHPAHYANWDSNDGAEHKFIAWYHMRIS